MKKLPAHPATNIGKIQRGETAFLKVPAAPASLEKMTRNIDQIADANLNRGVLASWWDKKRTQQICELYSCKLSIAQNIKGIHDIRTTIANDEYLREAKLRVEYVLLHNQETVLREATAMNLPPETYGNYMLRKLEAELRAEERMHDASVKLRTERLELEETFKAILTKSAVAFEQQKQLIEQISDLYTELEELKSQSIPNTKKRIKAKYLKQLIATKEAELASQSETVQATNGRGLEQIIKTSPNSD